MLSKHAALIVSLALVHSSFGVPGYAQERASLISPEHATSIYRHLIENHWVPETGLFLSYPDSMDHKLSQQASVYEQGAMGLLLIRLGDLDRAKGLCQYLKKTWDSEPNRPDRGGLRGFSNFYNAEFGTAGIERTIHLGPNAWAGLFIARLANTIQDNETLQFALDIQYWMANNIPHQDGAVAMGPRDEIGGAPWTRIYSTENNLSYNAFLTELLRSPRLDRAKRAEITAERDRVDHWLVHTAFDKKTYRPARGLNPHGTDTIAALDTVTWLVSAIGPRRLAERGIDPQRLMDNAANAFETVVHGQAGVDCSDQIEADFVYRNDHTPGGGRPANENHRLIWYEGLGQYIVALHQTADYYRNQRQHAVAQRYIDHAEQLTHAYDAAALKNYPGTVAYPYATAGRFFRDGWQTQAQGHEGPAASLISSVWRLFAGIGYDPLAGRQIGTVETASITLPRHLKVAHKRPVILFGTSEEMVNQAWRALDRGKWNEAIDQAKATIQEWSIWASRLQAQKQREWGLLLPYSGLAEEQHRIFKYWALNDVGAAYFILGKAYDQQNDTANAARAFEQVINRYPLAQVWDPKGWFWSPAEAISQEYVARSPDVYGAIMPQVLAEGSLYGKNPN